MSKEKEISLKELTDQIGIDLMLEVNKQVEKVARILGLSLQIKFYENTSEFLCKEDDRLVLSINKKGLYVKPFEFFRLKTLALFDEYEKLTGEKFGDTVFYNSLVKLQLKEKIDLFTYYYIIFILDYFNYEADESRVSKIKYGGIVFEAAKYEFVYKDSEKKNVQYQKVLSVLRLSDDSDNIRITRIYNGKPAESLEIKMNQILD